MVKVSDTVVYTPHAEHFHLHDHGGQGLAAIVGRVYPDGSADLFVLVPGKEPHWQDKVPPYGDHHSFSARAAEPPVTANDNGQQQPAA